MYHTYRLHISLMDSTKVARSY